jgi:hypothetical protein
MVVASWDEVKCRNLFFFKHATHLYVNPTFFIHKFQLLKVNTSSKDNLLEQGKMIFPHVNYIFRLLIIDFSI